MRFPTARLVRAALLAGATALLACGGGARAQDDDGRGRALYEVRCTGCHEHSVHQRGTRTAGTFDEVRGHVARWAQTVRAQWRDDEIDAVTRYLNERYYRHPCAQCGTRTMRSAGPRGG